MRITYRTTYFSKWNSPCILEHLLSNPYKAKKIIKVFQELGFAIKPSSNWFDIVKV